MNGLKFLVATLLNIDVVWRQISNRCETLAHGVGLRRTGTGGGRGKRRPFGIRRRTSWRLAGEFRNHRSTGIVRAGTQKGGAERRPDAGLFGHPPGWP